MSNDQGIEQIVDGAIHDAIVNFDPELRESYRTYTETFLSLVHKVESARTSLASRGSLIARLKSHLAIMAFEVGDHSEAEKLTADVLELISSVDTDFTAVALIRIKSLHLLGRHEEEIAEALKYAESEAFQGHALVHLLAKLARDHPQSIKWRESLISRVKTYVIESPSLAQLLESAHFSTSDPEEYFVTVADIIRMISLEESARALGGTSEE